MELRMSLAGLVMLGGLAWIAPQPAEAADPRLMTGVPSAAEFVDALAPAPKTRGIRPKENTGPAQVDLPIVTFAFDSAELTPEAQAVLDQLATALHSDRLAGSRFMIEGHTDTAGPETYNLSLSERRAAAVSRYLAERQVDFSRLQTVGKGEYELLDPQDGRSEINRRVRIINIDS